METKTFKGKDDEDRNVDVTYLLRKLNYDDNDEEYLKRGLNIAEHIFVKKPKQPICLDKAKISIKL